MEHHNAIDIYSKLNKEFQFIKNINEMKKPLEENWGNEKDQYVWVLPSQKELKEYVKKAVEASNNINVIMLLPNNSEKDWWHEYCTKGAIFYLKGPVKYKKNRAAIPSAVIMFGKEIPKQTFHVEII